jgi:chromosome partitioning protein
MGKIVAIVNQKGGVGKTTTAINVAASLAVLEKRVLLIDADPQANASSGMGFDVNTVRNSIYECLIGKSSAKESILNTEVKCFDIISSHIDLVGAEIEMLNLPDREKIMKSVIEKIRDQYDYIFIDCSPSLGLITVNALTAADSVIIPVQCEYFALEGLGKLLNTVKLIQARLNTKLEIEGFLLTMYDARLRLANQVVDEVRRHFGKMVFQTIIQRNVKLGESPSFGKPVILYDAASMGTANYLNMAKEIIKNNTPEEEKKVTENN